MSRKSYRPIPQCLLGVTVRLVCAAGARAAQPPVDLGTASSFAVLGGSTVTNTGPTVANGDLGVSPGGSITGFPPGIVNGAVHAVDAVADQAQADLTAGYDSAAGRGPAAPLPGDLGGLFMTAGVYNRPAALQLDRQRDLRCAGRSRCRVHRPGRHGAHDGRRTAASSSWAALKRATSSGSSAARRRSAPARRSWADPVAPVDHARHRPSAERRVLARGAAVTLDTTTVSTEACALPAADPGDPGRRTGASTGRRAGIPSGGGGRHRAATAGAPGLAVATGALGGGENRRAGRRNRGAGSSAAPERRTAAAPAPDRGGLLGPHAEQPPGRAAPGTGAGGCKKHAGSTGAGCRPRDRSRLLRRPSPARVRHGRRSATFRARTSSRRPQPRRTFLVDGDDVRVERETALRSGDPLLLQCTDPQAARVMWR